MRVVITVLSKDRVGIISLACALLAQHNVNILGISRTIPQGDFTMAMLADAGACDILFAELAVLLKREGKARSLDVRAQWEDISNTTYRI